ncbi:Homocysteine S-methyltransferase [Rhizobium sp. RU36D]|nr:Homocysteine S-methyltransferase [Rhizobium sp. RU36D]
MLSSERFHRDAQVLAQRAGRLAREVADGAARKVSVAGSLPPLFESCRPDRFQQEIAPAILRPLIDGLSPQIDFWLIETQSAIREARTALDALAGDHRPVFVSFTLKDEAGRTGPPELRSGEPVGAAVADVLAAGATGVFFNCSQPEVMSEAARAANGAATASIGDIPRRLEERPSGRALCLTRTDQRPVLSRLCRAATGSGHPIHPPQSDRAGVLHDQALDEACPKAHHRRNIAPCFVGGALLSKRRLSRKR